MLRRTQLGDFIACVFLFGMIAGKAAHFAFALMEHGSLHSLPALVAAVRMTGSSAITLSILHREVRGNRAKHG